MSDLLMELKQSAVALDAYKVSIKLYPKRFNSLLRGAHAARSVGDKSSALTMYKELLEVASDDSRRDGLKEARDYIGGSK